MCACHYPDPDEKPRFKVVTDVSEPPELTAADIDDIYQRARRIREAMAPRIRAMQTLTSEDWAVRVY